MYDKCHRFVEAVFQRDLRSPYFTQQLVEPFFTAMHDSTQIVHDNRRKFVEAILKRAPHLRYSIHLLEEPFFTATQHVDEHCEDSNHLKKAPVQQLGKVW